MEEEKGGTGTSLKISQPLLSADPSTASPLLPQPAHALVPAPAPAKNPPKEAEVAGPRQMFTVELRRGETTIVSWKKLLRESGSGNGEASSFITRNQLPDTHPVAGVHPKEDDLKHTIQPQNCFSAVIEKIERLYMGRESSDEEELDAPDDDQYDTEDSFIDDTELDEYFQVDKLSTKHNGYFVNRGKLEWVEPSSSPNLAPKKRKRKESTKEPNETDHERVLNEHVSMGIMKIKAAARNAPLVAKKLSPTEAMPSYEEHYQEGKLLKAKPNSSTTIYRKRPADSAIKLDISPPARLQNNEHSSVLIESKETNKRKFFSPKSLHKYSTATESFGTTIQVSREKAGGSQVEQLSKKVFNANKEIEVSAKMQRKEKHVYGDYPQNSSMAPYPTQALKHPFPHLVREGTLRPKGTTMERAIRDLEKIVELCRPLDPGVQEVDPSAQGIKRRLPQEVKQKLAKVARLSASQSKISEEELINRLMGFLGHLVQRKTLKRNMREMVELGLSAKQQKADKLLQIKKEVLEMIKARVSLLKVPEQQDALTDDFQDVVNTDEKRALRGRYCMDAALEDKICDLYDLHVEGMDEDKGPQSRKLYVELAELWPAGYMDNFGIKDAIYRAKKRRRHKLQSRGEERIIERKNTAAAAASMKPEEASAPEKQIPSLNPLLQSRILDRGNGGGIRALPAADAAKKRAAKMAKEKLIHRSGDESAPARPPPPRAAEIPAAAPPPFDQPS